MQLHVAVKRTAQVDQFAFAVVRLRHAGDKSRVGQARGNATGDVRGRGALRDILDTAIRQGDVNLLHSAITQKDKHQAYRRRLPRSRQVRVMGRSRRALLSARRRRDRKSTRLNSSHGYISYAVFCLKKKNT